MEDDSNLVELLEEARTRACIKFLGRTFRRRKRSPKKTNNEHRF